MGAGRPRAGSIRVPPINVVLAPIPRDGLAKRLRAIGRPAFEVRERRVPIRPRITTGGVRFGATQRKRRYQVLAADAILRLSDDERNGLGFGDGLLLRHKARYREVTLWIR